MAKDYATLASEANTLIPNNTTREVSAADIRGPILDLIDKLQAVEASLATSAELTTTNANLAALTTTVTTLTATVTSVSTTADQAVLDAAAAQTTADDNAADITALDTRLDAAEFSITDHETRIGDLEAISGTTGVTFTLSAHGLTSGDIGKPLADDGSVYDDTDPNRVPIGIIKSIPNAGSIEYMTSGKEVTLPISLFSGYGPLATAGRFADWDASAGLYVDTKPADSQADRQVLFINHMDASTVRAIVLPV